jgi:hypothetical protein
MGAAASRTFQRLRAAEASSVSRAPGSVRFRAGRLEEPLDELRVRVSHFFFYRTARLTVGARSARPCRFLGADDESACATLESGIAAGVF